MLNYLIELRDSIYFIIKKHKVFFFVFLASVLISIIIAIIASINYFHYFTIKNLTDEILVGFLNKKISLFSFFFKRFFQYLLIICLIFLCSSNRYTIFINILISCFIAFNIIFNFIILISIFGFFGVIHGIIVTLIVGIIFIFSLILLTLYLFDYQSSCSTFCSYFINYNKIIMFVFHSIAVVLIITLFEILIIPFSTSAFVIVF